MLKIILVFIFVFSSGSFGQEKLTVGVLYNNIFLTKKEAIIGTELWLKQMEKEDYGVNVDIEFYDDENLIIKDFLDGKIYTVVSDATTYLKHKNEIDKMNTLLWAFSQTNRLFEQYYLIKNKNSKFSLKNFKSDNVFYKDKMGKIWFESFVLKEKTKQRSMINKLEKLEKVNKLIFNIFFDKRSVSIIPKDLYDTMVELNPQVKDRIEIVKKSKIIFVDAVGFSNQSYAKNPKMKKALDMMSNDMKKDTSRFDVFSLTSMRKVIVFDSRDELSKLHKFYKEYLKLKAKYK